MTPKQMDAVKQLRSAMKAASSAGLALRVFDGSVLVCPKAFLQDGRYLGEHAEMSEWMSDCEDVTEGINADGGAGL